MVVPEKLLFEAIKNIVLVKPPKFVIRNAELDLIESLVLLSVAIVNFLPFTHHIESDLLTPPQTQVSLGNIVAQWKPTN